MGSKNGKVSSGGAGAPGEKAPELRGQHSRCAYPSACAGGKGEFSLQEAADAARNRVNTGEGRVRQTSVDMPNLLPRIWASSRSSPRPAKSVAPPPGPKYTECRGWYHQTLQRHIRWLGFNTSTAWSVGHALTHSHSTHYRIWGAIRGTPTLVRS